jgi:hypothetical protein
MRIRGAAVIDRVNVLLAEVFMGAGLGLWVIEDFL